MEQSLTKDQLGKLFVDLAIHKIENWTESHLINLRKSKDFPLCFPISNIRWIVGLFTIEKKDDKCWEVIKDNRLIHEFYSRQSAFFYTIFDSTRYYSISQNLLNSDRNCAKYSNEIDLFSSKLMTKNLSKDRREFLIIRLTNAKIEFEKARNELKKSLNRAKYHKLWDRMP
jgi:hypothetical protein